MQISLTKMRGAEASPEISVRFHRDYLIKRIREARPRCVTAKQLFQEIRTRGYQGALRTVQKFVAQMPEEGEFSEEILDFHKDYLIGRIREDPCCIRQLSQLLEEIRARGYLGTRSRLQSFLMATKKKLPVSATSLSFYKDYLIKRIEETQSHPVGQAELFKEIRSKGYKGSIRCFHSYLMRILGDRQPGVFIGFHKSYLVERIKGARTRLPATKLFREIRARGYLGSLKTVQNFMTKIRREVSPESGLEYHKAYLIRRLQGDGSTLPMGGLFEEIRRRGYRGTCLGMQRFVRKQMLQKAEMYPPIQVKGVEEIEN